MTQFLQHVVVHVFGQFLNQNFLLHLGHAVPNFPHEREEINLRGFSVKKTLKKHDYNTQACLFWAQASPALCG
jgi:hypothetical protein